MIVPGIIASNLLGGVASDPDFSSVVMLLSLDGTDGQTTTTDDSNSNHTMFFSNEAKLSTDQKIFGTASLRTDGIGDRLNASNSTDFNFGSGKFTIEGRFRFPAIQTGFRQLIGHYRSGTVKREWAIAYDGTVNEFQFWMSLTGSAGILRLASGFTASTNTWYTVAVDKDASSTYRMYIDGDMEVSATESETLFTSSENFTVGAQDFGGAATNLFADEIRVTKGVARYASDSGYTVATEAFPRS